MVESGGWLQASCSLFPRPGGGPYIPWKSLDEAVGRWRAEGLFSRFWFVRKMPGLKLRFEGREVAAKLQAPLSGWLRDAERANDIRGFRFTVYEPETYRFGGEAGMALAHAHFDAGTRLVLAYETSPAELRREVGRLAFSLANTSDLLIRALGDAAEIWDVWNRLHSCVVEYGAAPQAQFDDGWRAVFRGLDFIAAESSSAAGELATAAQNANRATAYELNALAESGALTVGVRAWLTAASVFEWNRFGLPDEPAALAEAIAVALREYAPDTAAG